jgi:hypothetical protein
MFSAAPRHRRARAAFALFLAPALLLAAQASALEKGFPPWEKLAEVDVIDIVTSDEDGELRESPVWFVMIDAKPYLRTNASRWLANIVRGSDVLVRIEGLEYEVGARVVDGEDIIEKVDAASLAKYGWQEQALFLRFAPPDILVIEPRSEGMAR